MAARTVVVVGTLMGAAALPAITADAAVTSNGRIAYSVGEVLPQPNLSGHSQVFTVNPDGSDVRQLTHVVAPVQAGDPNYSPDGRRILYVSNPQSHFQVWVMNADGSNQRRLVRDRGHDAFTPRWAPDGRHLVFTRCTTRFAFTECTIAVARANGAGLHNLTGGHWSEFDARYTPNGHHVVFSSNRKGYASAIWRVTPSGRIERRLSAVRREAFWPDFSPGGQRILFSNNFERPNSQLFTMHRDGTSATRLTHAGAGTQSAFGSYAPNGRKIVFDRGTPKGEWLATMNPDGSGVHRIVRTDGLTLADWGPAS